MKPRHLKNAPIQEAVFGIIFEPTIDLSEEKIADLEGILGSGFKHVRTDMRASGELPGDITIDEASKRANSESRVFALSFENDGDRMAVLITRDRLSISALRPYTSYDKVFRPALVQIAGILLDQVIKPSVVQRLGLRYINVIPRQSRPTRIFLSDNAGLLNIEGYTLSSMLQRYDFKLDEGVSVAVQIADGVSVEKEEELQFYLDIDCAIIDGLSPNIDGLLTSTDRLREIKNEVFFNILSEELIKEHE